MFVSQLTAKVTEEHLERFFEQIGKVNNIIMIRDKNTGRHKGFAYVEMADVDKIPDCLLFNNVVPDFQKFPILVKASEAEKNFNAKKDAKAAAAGGKVGATGDNRLYVGNINALVNEAQLMQLLQQYGPIESLNLNRDELGNSKGYAFVRFTRADSVALCLSSLNGMDLMGKQLKVNYVDGTILSKDVGTAHHTHNLDFDERGHGHVHLSSTDRMMLMAKLGQTAGIEVPMPPGFLAGQAPPLPVPVPVPMPSATSASIPSLTGVPSRCFMIRNMFNPAEEDGDGWDQEIKEDVVEECSKYGTVEHCHVEKHKPGGLVFLKFSTMESAVKAAVELNGRFFAGHMVTVTFLDAALYGLLAGRGNDRVPGDANEGLPAAGSVQALAGTPSVCFMIRNMFDPAEEVRCRHHCRWDGFQRVGRHIVFHTILTHRPSHSVLCRRATSGTKRSGKT